MARPGVSTRRRSSKVFDGSLQGIGEPISLHRLALAAPASNIAELDKLFLDGRPFDTASQYATRSPLLNHEACTTPMLLTAGRLDLATSASQAQQMYKALDERGVAAALAVYPRRGTESTRSPHWRTSAQG